MIIRTVARKELLDQLSSPKFVFLFAVSTVLILLSLYTGSASYVAARSDYQATDQLARRELEAREDYNEISRQGVKIARAPAPLSSVVSGTSSALGRSATVRPQAEPVFAPPAIAETPILAVLGELDFAVVVRVFLSLFVLLLTYDAIAGEKEAGTLKAVLANPVPRAQLLLGKTLGLFGTLLVAVAVPAILGLLVMKLGFRIELAAADWARLLSIGLVSALYLLAIFATGLFVSSATSRSSVAFLVLLLVWATFVEVLPKIAPMVAARFRPAPSFATVQSDRERLQREFQRGMMSGMQTAMQASNADAPPASAAEAEARQVRLDALLKRGRDSLNADLQTKLSAVEEAQRNRKDAFTSLALLVARISPAEALNHSVATLAGTDFEMQRNWFNDLIAYRGQVERFFSDKNVEIGNMVFRVRLGPGPGAGGGGGAQFGQPTAQRMELGDFPRFTARPESLGKSLQRAAPDLLILGLYAAVALMLAFANFMRYDVR